MERAGPNTSVETQETQAESSYDFGVEPFREEMIVQVNQSGIDLDHRFGFQRNGRNDYKSICFEAITRGDSRLLFGPCLIDELFRGPRTGGLFRPDALAFRVCNSQSWLLATAFEFKSSRNNLTNALAKRSKDCPPFLIFCETILIIFQDYSVILSEISQHCYPPKF